MRIAVGGFHHETNTFAPTRARLADFEAPDAWPGLTRGDDLPAAFAGMNIGISGFLEAAAERAWSLAPLLWANAGPSAHVERDAYERIAGELVDRLRRAGPVDGVYLCLHGAMVAEHLEDGEGELLARVRATVGDIPVVASLDLHANVTEAMLEQATAMTAYRSYPHLDMAETGRRAAALLAHAVETRRWYRHAVPTPFLIPLTSQCTDAEPARGLYRRLRDLVGEEVRDLSFAMGFPPADIFECGPVAFGYGDSAAAVEDAVETVAAYVAEKASAFAGELVPPDTAVARGLETVRERGGPVVLADTQDNPGAGADSDTTGLLRALVAGGAEGAVLGLLHDPEAAQSAHAAGQGATLTMRLGGRSGTPGDAPYEAEARVLALSDGCFAATGPFYAGSRMNLGPMALVETGGVRVVLSSRKQQAADRAMFAHLGIDLEAAPILALKSSVHFRADFGPLASEVIVVEAPGPNTADPAKLPYRNLRPGKLLTPRGPGFAPPGSTPRGGGPD